MIGMNRTEGEDVERQTVWKEARWRALESPWGHITLTGESRENMRGGWVFAEVTFVEVLYSKHIIINFIYTPEQLSLPSIMRRNGREHRYTNIDIFGSQFMLMLPKSFHRCNNNSKTQKTLRYLWALKLHWMEWKQETYYLTSSMLQSYSCHTAPTGLKTICRPMRGAWKWIHTLILTGMQAIHTEKNSLQ